MGRSAAFCLLAVAAEAFAQKPSATLGYDIAAGSSMWPGPARLALMFLSRGKTPETTDRAIERRYPWAAVGRP